MPLAIDPAINMWDQSQRDSRFNRSNRSMPSAPKVGTIGTIGTVGSRSPWTLPLPDPFGLGFEVNSFSFEEAESREPRYVQLGGVPSMPHLERQLDLRHGPIAPVPPQNAVSPVGPLGPLGPFGSMASLEESHSHGPAGPAAGPRSKHSPADPGLSGQRLKRVLHVKQAPIYKYAEWCSHWIRKGGRTPDDPMTPRSELTKSEFDIQYGAWRKALVEGPPQRA